MTEAQIWFWLGVSAAVTYDPLCSCANCEVVTKLLAERNNTVNMHYDALLSALGLHE